MSSASHASFSVSYDASVKAISGAVFAMLLSIGFATGSLGTGILFAMILVVAWAYSPSSYSISDGFLIVHRLIGNVRVPVAGIREVTIATPEDLSGSRRVFGSGGLFGYYGDFRSPKFGKSSWYVTNRNHAVVVKSDAGTFIFSPDDVDGFVGWTCPPAARLRSPARFVAPAPEKGHSATAWITVAIVMVVTSVVLGALFYSPGPPAYTLTTDSLTIKDRFYPVTLNPGSVDVKNVRVIDFATETEWQPVERTNGFGNAHYHAGFFKLENGDQVRMYRADSTRVVLLPPKGSGDPVLLETKDPGKFLAEVRSKWGSGS